MATIHDVAKRAGVAPITVSRVVNQNGYVSEDKRRRVEAAILELDYIPNSLGPSLRSKRTGTLALVVSDFTNPFWTTVARGIEDAANKRGYHVIIGNTDDLPEKQEEYLRFLLKKQVDGFLLVPVTLNSFSTLQKRHVPFVILDWRLPEQTADSVRGDSKKAAYDLTRHLLELGHRRIAVITGRQDHSTAIDRVEGAMEAFEDAGLSERPLVYWGEYNHQTGYDCAHQIVRSRPRVTAILATNNSLAVGTMRALLESGLRVPQDMSVGAFDEFPPQITYDPFFTVAAQPAYEMGQKATDLLLSRLDGNRALPPEEIVLPVEIIVRKSSAKPPAETQE